MLFRVGESRYRVRISTGVLFDDLGREAAGIYSWVEKTIWISGVIPLANRAETLIHELRHAWQKHFGIAVELEGDANQQSDFTLSVSKQFYAQGGADALMRLNSDGIIDRSINAGGVAGSTHLGAECSCCGTKFAPTQVGKSGMFLHADGRRAIWRWVDCEHCGHLQTWIEEANEGSEPVGVIIRPPEHLRSGDAMQFLAERESEDRKQAG